MEALEDQQINELSLLSRVIDPIYGNLVLANHPAGFMKDNVKLNFEIKPAPELGEYMDEILRAMLANNVC